MKLATLLILALSIATAQTLNITTGGTMQSWIEKTQTAERTVEIPGHYYVVRYEYGTGMVTTPAVYGAKAHYDAQIEVFEVIDGSKHQIGTKFAGQYVEGGCFEDKPETLIQSALKKAGRLAPEIEGLFEARQKWADLESMPLYTLDPGEVLTITSKGMRDLKAIVVDGRTVWERKP
jgi:hypothetical protein